jgi:hypothetical protein
MIRSYDHLQVNNQLNELRCINGDSLDDYLVLRLYNKIVG